MKNKSINTQLPSIEKNVSAYHSEKAPRTGVTIRVQDSLLKKIPAISEHIFEEPIAKKKQQGATLRVLLEWAIEQAYSTYCEPENHEKTLAERVEELEKQIANLTKFQPEQQPALDCESPKPFHGDPAKEFDELKPRSPQSPQSETQENTHSAKPVNAPKIETNQKNMAHQTEEDFNGTV
ncbi:MAG: hypothetical protein ACNI27_14245 [Desulfovibrio sp.]